MALLGLTALSACSTYSFAPPHRGNYNTAGLNLDRVQAAAAQAGPDFNGALVKEYAIFANELWQRKNWADTDYFSRKGVTAGRGVVVPPEDNGNFLVPLEVPLKTRSELTDGRRRLVAVLAAGAGARAPAIAARAQVRYDCWVEETEKDWHGAAASACRSEFLAAMAQLEGTPPAPPPGTQQFNIYFEFDRDNLTPEAQRIVDTIVGEVRADSTKIVLVGKADLTGSDPYNLVLSHRRADTVVKALEAEGIAAQRIDEHWVGFREPPVPTPPGVREPRNRVVEVTIH